MGDSLLFGDSVTASVTTVSAVGRPELLRNAVGSTLVGCGPPGILQPAKNTATRKILHNLLFIMIDPLTSQMKPIDI
jgi:hypothetical protein